MANSNTLLIKALSPQAEKGTILTYKTLPPEELKVGYTCAERLKVFRLARIRHNELKKQEKMIKIYVAGKVTGEDYQKCFDKFNAIDDTLTGFGYQVINPMKIIQPGTNWDDAMEMLKPHVINSDIIFFLADWQNSIGAIRERFWANQYKVEIVDYHQLHSRFVKKQTHAS